ncbi:MAG: 50S ribosomal protein L21 [Candidatus Omnitrophica bacterium]|jgi:large subunit ribosomal protein L21|nr:50S ribosomal protein L21 [Candidatus Omnitrophota bacterium]MDD5078296.1 50S ribosomal protein L21 [Candidatus Omnitrophota bacterium]
MYAIIEVGSKQYRVEKDETFKVDKQEVAEGGSIDIDKVLLVSDGKKVEIGQPYLKDAKVQVAVISKESLGAKTVSFKHRRRKNSHWKKGHRAKLTELKVKSIAFGS